MSTRDVWIHDAIFKVVLNGIEENNLEMVKLAELLRIGIDARGDDHVGIFSTILDTSTKASFNLVKKIIHVNRDHGLIGS